MDCIAFTKSPALRVLIGFECHSSIAAQCNEKSTSFHVFLDGCRARLRLTRGFLMCSRYAVRSSSHVHPGVGDMSLLASGSVAGDVRRRTSVVGAVFRASRTSISGGAPILRVRSRVFT